MSRLEIPEIRVYMCPICHVPYCFLKDAEFCRDKGFIGGGSKINPGLIVKGIFDDTFSVFFREFQKMHYRYDEFVNLRIEETKKGKSLKHINSAELKSYLKRDDLNDLKPKVVLLDNSEFEDFKRLNKRFMADKENLRYIGLEGISALQNIYNNCDFFEENKK